METMPVSLSQVYCILAQGHLTQTISKFKMTITNENMMEAVKYFVEDDRQLSVEEMYWHLTWSYETVIRILKDDLALSKCTVRSMPKQLTETQKMERIRCAKAFQNGLFRERECPS
ncbi:unnamed protein product [Lepeophtheirus salmonis]|uniref:(salmon louse) hypothetical protein n=1 Tax=Lepeophtheirus salmonis TaxID=72036 RepID=A0A7R8H6S5_LEPSM|nr:unnamed protein product [Lepeophtheirus salmonis]CAF2888551.1 unnamed protein product [Lepeophtheirus salmonis]